MPHFSNRIRNIFTVAFAVKAVVLLLEARSKRAYYNAERNMSPEDFSGIYGQALLSWLNRLIWQGARHLLKPEDLYAVSDDVASETLSGRFSQEWDKHVEDKNIGYGLIGAYFVVYFGLATTSALYWHRHYRFLSMLRGTLITAVYGKATNIVAVAKDNKASITLMSTDVERATRGLIDLHEMWANIFQVAIATWLLEIELGAACVGPVIVALGTTIWFSGYTASFQLLWIEKVQARIGITTSILGSMKAIKLSGLTSRVGSLLRLSRMHELERATRFRTLSSISVAIGNVPQLIAPVLTFAIYVGVSFKDHTAIDTTKLFTSLALILLASEPLFMLINGLIEFRSAIGCFARLETFLRSPARCDTRTIVLPQPNRENSLTGRIPNLSNAVAICNASFGWKDGEQLTTKSLSLEVPFSSLVMITGPVACGKTTLLKGILGETPVTEGRVELSSSSIAWCEQSPWLMNASIQANITTFSEFDQDLYSSVIHACDLDSDLEALQKGDATMIGSKGFALSGGQKQRIALARAVYARCPIIVLDDVFSQLDLSTKTIIFERLLGQRGLLRGWKTTVIMTIGASKFLPKADHIVVLSANGTVEGQGTFQELCAAGNDATRYITSIVASPADNNTPEVARGREPAGTGKTLTTESVSKVDDKALEAARQRGDFGIYKYYFACISWTVGAIFLLLQLAYAFFCTFPTVWLKWWADADTQESHSRYGYYIGVYTALQIVALALSAAVTWWSFNVMAVKTGIQLHNILAKTVMSAPLSFFSKVDSGTILTSQDIQLLDISLPLAVMVVTTTSAWIAISIPALGLVFYLVQGVYLRTSRQMRHLDLEEKAPVYTQFMETLDGLVTIRAFNWSRPSIKHNFEIVDLLELVITAIAVLVVGIVVGMRGSSSPGFTGIALTQIISFTTNLKYLIMFWTQLESSLGAVARIRQFEKETVTEDQESETYEPSFDWPSRGSIEISNLSAKYNERMTLDNISISIPAGSKVGFCGRTGSGKSSLLLTLFNLLTPESGTITIDGLDLSIIRRETLRSRLICIAEEPFLFPESVRENLALDSTTLEDQNMVQVLQQTGLWETIDAKGGLDAKMEDVHLSQGSKQLFNIARALLRKDQGKVLVMDEATSSIDTETDINIQSLIMKEFAAHTIISVAHKLDTIAGFDFVGVMDAGRLVEYGNPKALLQQQGSRFRELWDER
ncbi:multidrug resistance-like protein [Aureobasidium sp. EXF-12298]|nr:multidrug resistance-like protein [Aureobasidium sp. EXF-12298]KAI4764471.1 multidrug resistance-like protein [Aureobasidium sp. EXF-12344]KAI4782122.1 multidrug resistance-like protein [Aureobasidium sp. EXF-3400]